MSDTPSDLSHLHVERHGRGPLVLCTHGGADTGDTWREQVGFLAGLGRTAVSWDLRGHGRSAAPLDPAYYSRELAVADIGALVDSTPGPAVLMGHSLGGYLSLAFALRHPERVAALVLVATGPGFRDEAARAQWNEMARTGITKGGAPAEAVGLLAQHDSWVIDNLAAIEAPVLQVVGDGDKMFLRATRYAAEKFSGPVRTVVVEGAGHHVHRRAAEQVNAAIAAFLNELVPLPA
ncbi:MAG: alpha/beta fold hydrolase [Acidimicrobiales bacterium]